MKNNILPVFVPHGGCRQHCIFCDQRSITGFDRMPEIPALEKLIDRNVRDGAELAFYGGSFTALEPGVRRAYLSFAAKQRELGRIEKIRLSTHPAAIDSGIIAELKSFGVGMVELGIQSLDEEVLCCARRGHGRAEVFRAVSLLAESGLSWGVQLMVGLPGDTGEKDFRSVMELLPYHPAVARIYPVLVIRGTALASMWKRGDYQPLSLDRTVDISAMMAALFEYGGTDVIRMGLQPTEEISEQSGEVLAGPFHPSFGYLVRCRQKAEQMRLALGDIKGDVRFLAPENELPLLFGDKRRNVEWIQTVCRGKVAVSGMEHMKEGSVAVAPYSKKEKEIRLSELSRDSFLKIYTASERSKYCI